MCVTFLWNHGWAVVILFFCLLLSISSVWALNSSHKYKARDSPALELMLNGVCLCVFCCVNGGQVLRTTDLEGERLFLWPLHAERRTFYGCRILFPSSMSFIAGKKHQESREWGWLYQSLLCEHLRGIICPEFIAKEGTCRTTWNAVPLFPGRQMTPT